MIKCTRTNRMESKSIHKICVPVDCDLEFKKTRYQSIHEIEEEDDARAAEVRAWEEHRANRWFWERRADNQKMNDPNVMLEVLYYCPRVGPGCIVWDYREYHRRILGLEHKKRLKDVDKLSCGCGMRVKYFQRCFPRKEYRERFGESQARLLEQAEKEK